MPTPQIWSHMTHVCRTWATFTCYRVMGCGEGNLNPKSNFSLWKLPIIYYFTGRYTASLSNSLFLCFIKWCHQLLTLHSVSDRWMNCRNNWWNDTLATTNPTLTGLGSNPTSRYTVPSSCAAAHCYIKQATFDRCIFWTSTILLYHINILRIPWAVTFCHYVMVSSCAF
jgi:hypothetical protein